MKVLTLRELRENAGLTVLQLAAKAGVSQSFVYRVEEGKTPVSKVPVVKICKALDVDIKSVEGLNLR